MIQASILFLQRVHYRSPCPPITPQQFANLSLVISLFLFTANQLAKSCLGTPSVPTIKLLTSSSPPFQFHMIFTINENISQLSLNHYQRSSNLAGRQCFWPFKIALNNLAEVTVATSCVTLKPHLGANHHAAKRILCPFPTLCFNRGQDSLLSCKIFLQPHEQSQFVYFIVCTAALQNFCQFYFILKRSSKQTIREAFDQSDNKVLFYFKKIV